MSTGLANKVTALRYQTIKNYYEERNFEGLDDRMVGKVFGLSVSTIRAIRNTRDYDEYLATIKRWHKNQTTKRRLVSSRKVVMPSSGLALEEMSTRKHCGCYSGKQPEDGFAVLLVVAAIVFIIVAIIYL